MRHLSQIAGALTRGRKVPERRQLGGSQDLAGLYSTGDPSVKLEAVGTMLENGDQIGSYLIVRRIGEGGMGEVYQGRHRYIGREAAIKILRPELSRDERVVKRFFTEARATAAIRHPGIVEILDCDISPSGQAYLVMEYLQGEDLAHRIATLGELSLDTPLLIDLVRQIAAALAAAHGLGIVHRDLKPENIFLVEGPTPLVKILDFGVAKLLYGDGDAHDKTRTGSVLGTPMYMAPEQCRGAGTVDQRADIYALGCVLFEMITRRPPFVRSGAGEVLIAHMAEVPPRLSSLSVAIDELVADMLAKDPAARPQTMNEVLTRLAGLGKVGREAPAGRIATQILPAEYTAEVHERRGLQPGRFGAGGTQVMPSSRSSKNTTLGDTASALQALDPPPRASLKRWAVPAGMASLAGVVGLIVVLTRPSPAPVVSDVASPAWTVPVVKGSGPSPGATAPESAQVTVKISSQPSGAEVWVGDESGPRGLTPLDIRLRRDSPVLHATLRAEDYIPITALLDPNDPKPAPLVMNKRALPVPPTEEPHHHHRAHKAVETNEPFKAIGD
jgi:serine/threonine protein kinase